MPVKEKKRKTAKEKEKELEKKLENAEKRIDELLDKQKEEKRKVREEKKRKKELEKKVEFIRDDLKNQLLNQNKFGKQFDDMVENYIFYVKLKEDLQHDIKERGIRYSCMTGNGYTSDKPNESVKNLINVTTEMRKILQDLELKEPDDPSTKEGEGDDLL